MNGEFQKLKDAEAVIPQTINVVWSLNGNFNVTNSAGGTSIGNQIIQTLSCSGTSTFHRVKPWETIGTDEWRVLTSTRDVIQTGGEASSPPFFRDCMAFYEITLNDTKDFSGNVRTVGAYDPGADPPEDPPTPVDTPITGTLIIGVALYRDALKNAHWFFYFSEGFGNLLWDSDSDPAADLAVEFENGVQMTTGGGTDFGRPWSYNTPDGTGYPGYTVNSWDVNLSFAVST